MTTYDNAPPLPEWQPEPRRSPFDSTVSETAELVMPLCDLGEN